MTVLQTIMGLTGVAGSHAAPHVLQASVIHSSGLYNGGGSLKRLYWFEADPLGGPWVDSSGNSGDVTKLAGADPLNVAEGGLDIDSNDIDGDGLALDSGFNISASFTVAAIIKSTTSASGEQFAGWWGSSHVAYPEDQSDPWPHFPGPYPNMRSDDNTHGFLDDGQDQIASASRINIAEEYGPVDQACAIAFRADGPNGVIDLTVLNGGDQPWKSYVHWKSAALVNYYNGFTAYNHTFGLFPYGSVRPVRGFLYAYAIWNAFVDDEMLKLSLRQMAMRVVDRGTPVFNWQG